MADNYTALSTGISVFNIDATEKLLNELKRQIESRRDDDDWKKPDWVTVDEPCFIEDAFSNVEIVRNHAAEPFLWIHADEAVDFEAVGDILRRLIMEEPDDEIIWQIPYASTCSKPRIGEFGGGTPLVTKTAVSVWSAESIVDQIQRVLGKDSLMELLSLD